ncbi:putative F-box-containing protein [Namao virus]|nr:putative F-box-containing protein [Namao virus]
MDPVLLVDLIYDILLYLHVSDVLTCRRVSTRWRDAVDIPYHWKRRFCQEQIKWSADLWSWHAHYLLTLCCRNLLVNPNAELGLYGWRVEQCDGIDTQAISRFDTFAPSGVATCFISRRNHSRLLQTVDLNACGYSRALLDEVQPVLVVESWHSPPQWDLWCEYYLRYTLKSTKNKILDQYEKDCGIWRLHDYEWKRVHYSFKQYGPSARYIEVSHVIIYRNFNTSHQYLGISITKNSVRVQSPWSPAKE